MALPYIAQAITVTIMGLNLAFRFCGHEEDKTRTAEGGGGGGQISCRYVNLIMRHLFMIPMVGKEKPMCSEYFLFRVYYDSFCLYFET